MNPEDNIEKYIREYSEKRSTQRILKEQGLDDYIKKYIKELRDDEFRSNIKVDLYSELIELKDLIEIPF